MQIINLTPHDITLIDSVTQEEAKVRPHRKYQTIRVVQSSRIISRIQYGEVNIPIKIILPNQASDAPLPPQENDTIYVVSRVVADTFRDTRPDFVFPYDFLRKGKSGEIRGNYSLARFCKEK